MINLLYDNNPANFHFNMKLLNYAATEYAEQHRFYHKFDHIADMILLGKKHFKLSPQQYLAIVFHDIVYNPKSHTNEEDSADHLLVWAGFNCISLVGFIGGEDISTSINIIMDTKGHYYPTCEESREVLDLDLERLARPFQETQFFGDQIRKEFSHLTNKEWIAGRKQFFQHFLSVDPIFNTDYGRTNWEPKARQNVEMTLAMM